LQGHAGVAKSLAQRVGGLPLRLGGVLDPFAGQGQRASLRVADGLSRCLVDADEIRRTGDPAAADFGPVAAALTGALDQAVVEAVDPVVAASDSVEERALTLQDRLENTVGG